MSIKIMQQVWENAVVTQGTLLVLLVLADGADEQSRQCWPSVRYLASRSRLSERQVQRCITELVDANVLHVGANEGRGGSNLYHIFPPEEWRGDKMSGGDVDVTGGVTPMSPGGVTPMSPPSEPSLRTVIEPSSCVREQLTLLSEEVLPMKQDRFGEFWKVYPKKVEKVAARKAWDKAIKAGADPASIIHAATVYAKSEAVARGFTKHPQGWLNGERWEDEGIAKVDDAAARRARLMGPQFGEVVR